MNWWRQLFATKSLELLHAEMEGDKRLRRVLGPIGLTSLGIGAIIGAGIFVMTGRVAADEAGPAILLSFVVAGFACTLAALCYAEFASLAPVAGSAYTYAYATLGELFAWIIGWDLILEYAMSAAVVAASWSKYLNELLFVTTGWRVPDRWCHDPFSMPGAYFNLPAVLILGAVTAVLVIGIRESAASNTALVVVKLAVVIFVILVGIPFINPDNWTNIPPEDRKLPEMHLIPELAHQRVLKEATDNPKVDVEARSRELTQQALAQFQIEYFEGRGDPKKAAAVRERHEKDLAQSARDRTAVTDIVARAKERAPHRSAESWGMLSYLGINAFLERMDDSVRSPFMPYGISGIMLGAALVFFAFIGFDSISTHSEEAIKPQRDVPIGILASLVVCTILYMGVAAVITGMVPYPEIDTGAAVASAFRTRAEGEGGVLHWASGLIAAGGLAGMTSVLLITFLSQARIFLAMARDGLMPRSIFGAVHEKFRTPHISTIVTGIAMALVAAFTPIEDLEEMVNVGTFFAFVVVCAAVLILRIKRPDAHRPFRCPLVYLVAPLGILVNLAMMMFLKPITWARLVIWLALGLVIYFSFGFRYSALAEADREAGGRARA